MKDTSPVHPDLKVGARLRSTHADWHGVRLTGKIVGFLDEVDLDAMDCGATEEEATLIGGTIVLELDKVCRSHHIDENDDIVELTEHFIYSDEILVDKDWEVTT